MGQYDSEMNQLESQAMEIVESVREEYVLTIRKMGLWMDAPELSVLTTDRAEYSSEIRIYIRSVDDNEIQDCLEFFVFWKGSPRQSPEEIRNWLVEQISTLQ